MYTKVLSKSYIVDVSHFYHVCFTMDKQSNAKDFFINLGAIV